MGPEVVIWNVAPFLPSILDVEIKKYYQNVEVKLNTQLKFKDKFPEAILFPGIWPDFGAVAEPSAFGSDVVWFRDEAPFSKPCIKDSEQIKGMKIPNPERDGLMKIALEQFKYMWDNVNETIINEGYLKGVGYSMGPLETAGLLMGYDKFFLGLYEFPEMIKQLIDKVTITIIKWLSAQEEINGKLKRLFIADHVPSEISRDFFLEFGLPAFNKIFNEFPEAFSLWHNEGKMAHIMDYIDEVGCDIFHCSGDIKQLQTKSKKVIMMGTLDPLSVMLNGTSDSIEGEVFSLLENTLDYDRLFISSAGGMAPFTPLENINALFSGREKFFKLRSNK